jgi:hypothetical protein
MSDTAEQLRAFVLASSDVKAIIGDRMYEDKVPQSMLANPLPFIWFSTRLETPANVLNGSVGELPDNITFDLECVSRNKPTSKDLARVTRALLNNYRSSTSTDFGGGSTKGVFVLDKDSDYAPVNGDTGQYVQALDVQVWL